MTARSEEPQGFSFDIEPQGKHFRVRIRGLLSVGGFESRNDAHSWVLEYCMRGLRQEEHRKERAQRTARKEELQRQAVGAMLLERKGPAH